MEVIKNECISKLDVVQILQKAYAEGRIKAKDGLVSVLDDINAADVQPVNHWCMSRSCRNASVNCCYMLNIAEDMILRGEY